MAEVLQEIISILVSGITTLANGLGTGIKSLVESIFLQVNGTTGAVEGLSTFGGIIIVFAGISLAIGLSRYVLMFVSSLGARK